MRCVIHIGPSKTGTSSIQHLLRVQRPAFAANGFYIPAVGNLNMAEFWAAAMREDAIELNRTSARLGFDRSNFFERKLAIRQNLERQFVQASKDGYHTILVTSESLSGLGVGPANAGEVDDLHDWLVKYCAAFVIVAALRRQDLRAVSRYKNLVKNKVATAKTCLVHAPSMDLDALLERWAKAFGREAMRPIFFPDSVAEPLDLLKEFCAVADIRGIYDPAKSRDFRRNSAIDGRAIEILRRLNTCHPDREWHEYPWGLRLLERKLLDLFSKADALVRPARRDAQAFFESYSSGNRRVASEYFPDRTDLFMEDFSMYPEEEKYPDPSSDDLIRVIEELVYDSRLVNSPHRRF